MADTLRRFPFLFAAFLACGLAFGAADTVDSLIGQGKAYLRQGQYHLAKATLLEARKMAATPTQQAVADGSLGMAERQMNGIRDAQDAEKSLRQAIDSGLGAPQERARWMAALAELEIDRDASGEARRLYAQALALAGDDPILGLSIRLGQVREGLMPWEKRLEELQRVYDAATAIPVSADRAALLINLAHRATGKDLNPNGLGQEALVLAYGSLEQAKQDAIHAPRLLAEALDGLAGLYLAEKRGEEGLRLNRLAIQAAQSIDAHDLLWEMEDRQGDLFKKQGRTAEALASYLRAVDHIEAIFADIPAKQGSSHAHFRDTYINLADLLLSQAGQSPDQEKNPLLQRARAVLELIKQTEVVDFLAGSCSVLSAKTMRLDRLDKNAQGANVAVIYPINLPERAPERLEILVDIGGEIRQFTVKYPDKSAFKTTIGELKKSLAQIGRDDAKIHARQLHDWLIKPIEDLLRRNRVDTLVVIPDAPLRAIPLAALYDGEHYLVEKYAIVTSPGLTLRNPSPLAGQDAKALLAGTSEPGPELRKRLQKDPDLQQYSTPLPGVTEELANLSFLVANDVLEDDDFTEDKFKQQLMQKPYTVLHIASHGKFGGTADTSFIMAYDKTINIDDLDQLLKSDKFERKPIDLLTLSACQTAEGDDRTPLGLSGVALKANARSVLGSLWPVDDATTARFMPAFYKALLQPGTSKAQALRQTQLALLKDKSHEHPYYWAPFILVGNWQ